MGFLFFWLLSILRFVISLEFADSQRLHPVKCEVHSCEGAEADLIPAGHVRRSHDHTVWVSLDESECSCSSARGGSLPGLRHVTFFLHHSLTALMIPHPASPLPSSRSLLPPHLPSLVCHRLPNTKRKQETQLEGYKY